MLFATASGILVVQVFFVPIRRVPSICWLYGSLAPYQCMGMSLTRISSAWRDLISAENSVSASKGHIPALAAALGSNLPSLVKHGETEASGHCPVSRPALGPLDSAGTAEVSHGWILGGASITGYEKARPAPLQLDQLG
ncbi:hypothetical protein DFH09DRAFT_1086416 [Mycena vulgaris]|nr:hypothetical protein DFH09DRAFT_1086416 [Mycena vulgaris]